MLQGNIALDTAVFPENTPGFVLDVFARRSLWEAGQTDMSPAAARWRKAWTLSVGRRACATWRAVVRVLSEESRPRCLSWRIETVFRRRRSRREVVLLHLLGHEIHDPVKPLLAHSFTHYYGKRMLVIVNCREKVILNIHVTKAGLRTGLFWLDPYPLFKKGRLRYLSTSIQNPSRSEHFLQYLLTKT